ncbi:MAG: 4Fe-4S dicluster domain-containing protein [Desulfovibrio sp.]|nr:4Fe-4S dicluster domain-containing protein [Desulfovibrio sp.]
MNCYRFLAKDALSAFLAFLAERERVLVPVEKNGARSSVVFEEWHEGLPFTMLKSTVPPKAAVLPQCEVLFTCRRVPDEGDQNRHVMVLDDTLTAQPTVIVATRPCDARGFAVLDRPYLNGLYQDPYYAARRKELTVLTLTCPTGCESCFCHWVGGGPSSPEGSDVLLTEIEGGYLCQSVTEKGRSLLERSALPDGEDRLASMQEARKKAYQSLGRAPDLKTAPQRISERFSDLDFWNRWTEACISCGACTYFCPTCYCFTITDEGDPAHAEGGRRLRSWDNCMSSLFTREASGHNPRRKKAERMRNRISHKYATYPENWGVFSCSGCGRCVSNCPTGIDIRAILLSALGKEEDMISHGTQSKETGQ